MSKTNIDWAQFVLNPFVGCSKCSPACENCYAMRFAARLAKNPSKHCGSRNVELMYLGSKNRLDGGSDTPPITKCRDCGKLSDMPIETNLEKPKDKFADFMDAVINISKSLKNMEIHDNKYESQEKKACPHCGGLAILLTNNVNRDGERYYIQCSICNMSGPVCRTKTGAIKYWNSIQIDKYRGKNDRN